MVVANTRGYKPTLLETLCRWGYSLVLAIAIPFAFIHLLIKALFSTWFIKKILHFHYLKHYLN